MARGKVGDVVFYRMNGVQMSRVRNRAPKNPRSVEQMYQRAIIASVMKLYSAGKEIFDHAFQGYTIGEGCMRRFNSVNARILREQVVNDVNNVIDVTKQIGRVTNPKSLSFTPMIGCMISEGTLEQNLFYYTPSDGTEYPPGSGPKIGWSINATDDELSGDMTMNAFLSKAGIYAGDIFTFCFGNINTDNIVFQMLAQKANYATVFKSYFEWIRLIVKSDISDSIKLSAATFADVFDIEANAPNITFNAASKVSAAMTLKLASGVKTVTTGCIRSRLDVDLRSTSYMVATNEFAYGIVPAYMLDAWMMEVTKVGTSDLILEGGDEGIANTQNLMNLDNTTIIAADIDENPVPIPARHRGTSNNKK